MILDLITVTHKTSLTREHELIYFLIFFGIFGNENYKSTELQ